MRAPWTPLASSIRWSRGKLALREDGWRLPDGTERAYPVLAVGVTVGVLGFVEPERVVLVRQFRHLARARSWELPGRRRSCGLLHKSSDPVCHRVRS